MQTPRWEDDPRGVGVADGAAFRPEVARLLDGMAREGWATEDPDAHLLPHLRRAAEAPGSPWSLQDTAEDGGVFTVTLGWRPADPRLRHLERDVFGLIGTIAERSTHVQGRILDDAVEFDVTTGMLEGDTPFAPHGHLLRLRVTGEDARAVAEGARALRKS